jgi:PKD repeat protein
MLTRSFQRHAAMVTLIAVRTSNALARSTSLDEGQNSACESCARQPQTSSDSRRPDPFQPRGGWRKPRSAQLGSTPEARAAYERLTPEQKEAAIKKLREYLQPAVQREMERRAQMRPPSLEQIFRGEVSSQELESSAMFDAPLAFTGQGARQFLVRQKGSSSSRASQSSLAENQSSLSSAGTEGIEPLRPPDECYPYPYPCEPGNLPPRITSVTASPTSGAAPLAVNFSVNAYDADGYIVDYFWTFGDGASDTGALVAHTYQAAGSYTATITVTDDYGDTASASVVIQVTGPPSPPPPPGSDADADGLPDDFENQVADAFTPIYHVGNEQPGTGFALFGDYVPQTPVQVFPPVPPISHFRVQPLGFLTDPYGNQYGFLRIDYLTLWNRDDGLDVTWFCRLNLELLAEAYNLAGIGITVGDILESVTGHMVDNERSAVLVAAPVSAPNVFNTNPWAYSAYSFFTTAHEGSILFDQSRYYYPDQPVPAGWHIHLWLSRSKHGTYPFHPAGFPIFRPVWILLYFSGIEFLYGMGWIDEYTYLAFAYAGDVTFYSCIVERFDELGVSFAATRSNVGEPSNPINGSHFIQDTQHGLRQKLEMPLW